MGHERGRAKHKAGNGKLTAAVLLHLHMALRTRFAAAPIRTTKTNKRQIKSRESSHQWTFIHIMLSASDLNLDIHASVSAHDAGA